MAIAVLVFALIERRADVIDKGIHNSSTKFDHSKYV
jgi:hypothetical protein